MSKRCKEIQEWIETEVQQPMEVWENALEKRCREEDCDWWTLCLNLLFCWMAVIVIKVVRLVLVTIIKAVTRIVCEIVNTLLNFFAAIVNAILAIPIIGPFIKAIIRAVSSIVSYVVGLLDGLGRLIGIRITKHLQVHVIPLCEGIIPLAYETHLAQIMRETERIFYARAQIRVHTTFHEPILNPPENALRLGTELELILDEAWLKGTWHQGQTIKLFESNLSSLLAVGHPIVVYVVREVGYDGPGTVIGASGGPFTDWIAVERDAVIPEVVADAAGNPATPVSPYPPTVASFGAIAPANNPAYRKYTIAHELCHALGLMGHANSSPGELMVPGDITGDALSPFQVGIIRSSPHVTFT
jgi:hypothetical protein